MKKILFFALALTMCVWNAALAVPITFDPTSFTVNASVFQSGIYSDSQFKTETTPVVASANTPDNHLNGEASYTKFYLQGISDSSILDYGNGFGDSFSQLDFTGCSRIDFSGHYSLSAEINDVNYAYASSLLHIYLFNKTDFIMIEDFGNDISADETGNKFLEDTFHLVKNLDKNKNYQFFLYTNVDFGTYNPGYDFSVLAAASALLDNLDFQCVPAPIPSSLLLFGSSLLCMLGWRRALN
jgi:hypothetical protein